jgi:hypothetical protein
MTIRKTIIFKIWTIVNMFGVHKHGKQLIVIKPYNILICT